MASPDRYTVLQKIADGGMAEIYLGTQHGTSGFERPIVIKRIRTSLSMDPKFRNMLIDEAHIAMSLVHSNIVQVLDLGSSQGFDFLVLELVDGWDLHELLIRAQNAAMPLPPSLSLHVGAEVCRALAFAHGKKAAGLPLGIVHRDISPHNILVSEQAEVKLTDFGIATALHKRERTVIGVVKGKLGFMSPEQAAGRPLDLRSDLFSLGTTLYLLVTGKRPFVANTDLEVLLRMQECEFPPPETVMPDLAPELAALVKKAMQKKPEDRFQSAEEMLDALEHVQRTVYEPASQTELKRWLATLSVRDGILPTSLRPPPLVDSPEEGELRRGSELILQEVEPDEVLPCPEPSSIASPPRPSPAPEPSPPLPPPAAPEPPPEPKVAVREHTPPPEAKPPAPGPPPEPTIVTPPPEMAAPQPQPPAPEPTIVVSTEPARPISPLDFEPPPYTPEFADSPLPPPKSSPMGAIGIGVLALALMALAWWVRPTGSLIPSSGHPSDVLQGAAIVAAPTDAGDAGAGADGSILAPPPSTDLDAGLSNEADAGEAGKERLDIVSVHIDSTPPGATVLVNRQAFGTTPINLRFKTELTYDLLFQLDGYPSLEKRVYISKRKGQTIQVDLERKKRFWLF